VLYIFVCGTCLLAPTRQIITYRSHIGRNGCWYQHAGARHIDHTWGATEKEPSCHQHLPELGHETSLTAFSPEVETAVARDDDTRPQTTMSQPKHGHIDPTISIDIDHTKRHAVVAVTVT
jgi:hypothetical protein